MGQRNRTVLNNSPEGIEGVDVSSRFEEQARTLEIREAQRHLQRRRASFVGMARIRAPSQEQFGNFWIAHMAGPNEGIGPEDVQCVGVGSMFQQLPYAASVAK